jgi:mannose-6-phosphate isomerase-like protein (cupin superfamily)
MKPHDLNAILASISEEDMRLERGDPSRIFGQLDRYVVGAVRFSGVPPWERHPAGDQLLHVLDGELELCVLAAEGRMTFPLRAGSVFVVPRGLWHRTHPRGAVSMFFATPASGGEESWADDPLK